MLASGIHGTFWLDCGMSCAGPPTTPGVAPGSRHGRVMPVLVKPGWALDATRPSLQDQGSRAGSTTHTPLPTRCGQQPRRMGLCTAHRTFGSGSCSEPGVPAAVDAEVLWPEAVACRRAVRADVTVVLLRGSQARQARYASGAPAGLRDGS